MDISNAVWGFKPRPHEDISCDTFYVPHQICLSVRRFVPQKMLWKLACQLLSTWSRPCVRLAQKMWQRLAARASITLWVILGITQNTRKGTIDSTSSIYCDSTTMIGMSKWNSSYQIIANFHNSDQGKTVAMRISKFGWKGTQIRDAQHLRTHVTKFRKIGNISQEIPIADTPF